MPSIDELAQEVVTFFPKIMKGVYGMLPPEWKLTVPQMSILMAVHDAGTATISELARSRKVSLPTITNMVERLIRQKLLERVSDPRDRRKVGIRLTKTGAQNIRIVLKAVKKRWGSLLQHLTPEEREGFLNGIRHMAEVLAELEPGKPAYAAKRRD